MKRFNNLKAIKPMHCVAFDQTGTRHTLSGVCTGRVNVFGQDEDMDGHVLLASFPPGEFKFELGHVKRFAVFLDFGPDDDCSLYVPPGAHELVHSPDDTWTSVAHRPAMDPNLAAIHAQMRRMQMQMLAQEANRKAERERERRERFAASAAATAAAAAAAATAAQAPAAASPAEAGNAPAAAPESGVSA